MRKDSTTAVDALKDSNACARCLFEIWRPGVVRAVAIFDDLLSEDFEFGKCGFQQNDVGIFEFRAPRSGKLQGIST